MNIARTIRSINRKNVGSSIYRKFRFSAANYESSEATHPKVQEEKFDFEDLKVIERTERRKPKIEPFMKNIFASIFDRELLAYPEILNKEESEALDDRVAALESIFGDLNKTKEERLDALKRANMFGAPVSLTNGGLASNNTESLRYLEVIASDLQLVQTISDHWVALHALKIGLTPEQYQQIIGDLITGENTISLCIKERLNDRILQPDFRSKAELDGQEIWRVSGEKVCLQGKGYFLVLCQVEGDRLRAMLVHPGAKGIVHNGQFVTFQRTPATPLSEASEPALAQTLGLSRLYSAAICRTALRHAMDSCVDFIKQRVVSGKPLAELSTTRTTIGDTFMDLYASESAEYFTAGLLDGYLEPDAEVEMAMCRNFIANQSLATLLRLQEIPSVEGEEEWDQRLREMRRLASKGETLDGNNMFIALNGIHQAGKKMSGEIRQMRNPLLNPSFIFKKILADRHQERDEPKLTLQLAEHLHPSLRRSSELLEYCVLRMRYASETLMARHGMEVSLAFTELNRLAEAATYILIMTSVLARASRSYCIGIRHAELEMKLAACFVEKSKDKVQKLIKDIDGGEYLNLDHYKIHFGRKVFEVNPADPILVEKPTARVFW